MCKCKLINKHKHLYKIHVEYLVNVNYQCMYMYIVICTLYMNLKKYKDLLNKYDEH